MIASEKRPTSFGRNTSFSSYSNAHNTEERFMLKLTHPPTITTKKKAQDDELGIFGAEKYFTGAMDEPVQRLPPNKNNGGGAHYHSNKPQEKHEPPKPKTTPSTPSVRSESSWNSRRGLLVSKENTHKKKKSVKSLFASYLGCNCNDTASVKITDNKVHVKEVTKQPVKDNNMGQNPKPLSSRWVDEDFKKEDCFTFPVLNKSSMLDVKLPQVPQGKKEGEISRVFGSPVLEKGKKSFSLERKLTMLNWDGVTPRAENMDISKHNDTASDASSDLFEIESFSTNENNSFLARQVLENNSEGRPSNVNAYAPSEASVDWSVITASVADFSTTDDLTMSRTVKGTAILSGCTSIKAVRVSGDGYCTTGGGGEKAAAMAGPTRREWCRRLDSVTPIQADTKGLGAGSASNRGQNGLCSVPRTHALHHLYVQQ